MCLRGKYHRRILQIDLESWNKYETNWQVINKEQRINIYKNK